MKFVSNSSEDCGIQIIICFYYENEPCKDYDPIWAIIFSMAKVRV